MPRPHPRALRERVVTAHEDGEGSYAELAERFGAGEASVDRWLALKRKSGDVAPRAMGGAWHKRKIGEAGKAFIVQALRDVPESSLVELVQAYEEEFGDRVGRETMRVTVAELDYTRRRAVRRAPASRRPDVVEDRQRFAAEQGQMKAERLVFLDESGVSTALSHGQAWSPSGEKAVVIAPLRARKLTLIGAIAVDGVRGTMEVDGSMDGDGFRLFLDEGLGPQLHPGDVVVMDRIRAHQVSGVEAILAKWGASALYLPSYSPEYNPIEICWAWIKRDLRKVA